MENLFAALPATVMTLIVSLTVTLIFNKVVNLPKERQKQKEADEAALELAEQANKERDEKIANLENAINELPKYRAQSIQIQAQLQSTDTEILKACEDIKSNMLENRVVLNERIDRLEKREKNAIRAKLLDEYRLFTDEVKNPMLAWSEMEHHAFFELVKDYEDLNGNDYVHSTVIPAMNELIVISMSDKQMLLKLMNSRKL